MTVNRSKVLSEPSAAASQRAALLSLGLVAGFLFLLITLHFIEPEFDPNWRWISEYELGRYGWLMQIAFWKLRALRNAPIQG